MPYFTDLGGPTPKLVRDFIGESIKESPCNGKENVMTDYIGREAAIKALSHGEGCGHVCKHNIERIPAADVIKVVRCVECYFFREDEWAKVDGVPIIVAHNICKRWGGGCTTKPDGYCHFAQEIEGEKDNV